MEIVEKIITHVPLTEVLHKKRILEDNETGKIIDIKRGRLTFELGGERIKSKTKKLIFRIEPEPPPHV